MNIFYAVQATGNGHISRAMELIPFLEQYGNVDVFLSGNNSNLTPNLPVKFRSKGVSLFYGDNGGLDYIKMAREFTPFSIWKEAKQLPVESYDIIINDFEFITSLACRIKNIPSINFGHQASFMSDKTPRPNKINPTGERILKGYAKATDYVGLHFEEYDDFIFPPILKANILSANPKQANHITVYLSHYSDEMVLKGLSTCKNIPFELFSKKAKQTYSVDNITVKPVDNYAFTESMIHSTGVITGAGFEAPAEALYLGKKLICLPIKGQYEQMCNAEALKRFNVPIIEKIDDQFTTTIENWMNSTAPTPLQLKKSTYEIVQEVIEKARNTKQHWETIKPLEKTSWLKIFRSQIV